jgi:hypothetical protein
VRRLIADGRLAARLVGTETRQHITDRECPICFLHYVQINETQCCKATLCTECFLQVRPQKDKHSVCPFCNHGKLYVAIAKRLDATEIQEREEKEQRMIELAIHSRVKGENEEVLATKVTKGFGSSLDSDEFVTRARQRGKSFEAFNGSIGDDIQLLRQLSLTSEDRLALEREMRAQHSHPLAVQMEMEAEEQRIAHEMEHHRSNSQKTQEAITASRSRLSSGGDSFRNRRVRLNPDLLRMGSLRGNVGHFNDSLDDMVVMEAAILLSIEEEAARAKDRGSDKEVSRWKFSNSGLTQASATTSDTLSSATPSLTEEEQLEMAIKLSMQEQPESAVKLENPNIEGHYNSNLKVPESLISARDAAISKATGVASLSGIMVDEDDDDDDDEESIPLRQTCTPTRYKSGDYDSFSH